MYDVFQQLSPSSLELTLIYLDPNNPRFAEDGRAFVSDSEIAQEARQEELMSKMEREHAVDRLKDSMETSGYLPVDRIIVRPFSEDKYVVLEGNRRISAAKRLWTLHHSDQHAVQLEPPILDSLRRIPVLIYTGSDPEAAWLFQGIRHISGVKDWSAYNKSKLLVEQMERQAVTLTQAGRMFGVSAWQAGQWMRGYYTYLQILDHPDYHRDVDTRVYPYLQEVHGRSNIALKEWMGWNEETRRFENSDNFDQFLSWLYPKTNENGDFDPDAPAEWSQRKLSRALDIRTVSDLCGNYPDEFRAFRQGMISLSVAQGRAAAKVEESQTTVEDYVDQIKTFHDNLNRVPIMQIIAENYQEQISNELSRVESLIQSIKNVLGYRPAT